MRSFATRFLRDESGATAVEYGLAAPGIAVVIIAGAMAIAYGMIAAGIAVVIIAAVNAVGSSLETKRNAAALAITP